MKPNPARSYRGLFWGLALAGLFLDQVSKYEVFKWLYPGSHVVRDILGNERLENEHVIVPGVFKLHVAHGTVGDQADGLFTGLRTWSADVLPNVNHGALFGFLSQYSGWANAIFAVVSITAALAIVYWSARRSTAGDLPLCAALGLILAGTLGNLYDRIVFDGVRDFLYFHWIEWPVFNVADCCLVCGAFLLLAQAFLSRSVPVPSEGARSSQMAEAN